MLQRPTLPHVSRFSHSEAAHGGLPFPSESTPFPNLLIDRIMPDLSDTEWRLLCVVCRQTLGFVSQGGQPGRRTRDWLTHSQLKARTGRASEAVSRAIDGLVRKNLIEVRTYAGEPLLTPPERRRCQGMLFFSLAPRLIQTPTAGGCRPSEGAARNRADRPDGNKPDGNKPDGKILDVDNSVDNVA
jgi:hypothetical protein